MNQVIKAPLGCIIDDQGNVISGQWRCEGGFKVNDDGTRTPIRLDFYYFNVDAPELIKALRKETK